MENGDVVNGITLIEIDTGKRVPRTNIKLSNWKCHCGNYFDYNYYDIKDGRVKSCGCFRPKYYVGETYNHISIKEILDIKNSNNNTLVIAVCYCGKEFQTAATRLRGGKIMSCGCGLSKDIAGEKLGGVTAIEKTDKRLHGSVIWKCFCDYCQHIVELPLSYITRKNRTSCGCYVKSGSEHHAYNPKLRDEDRSVRLVADSKIFARTVFERDNYKCIICGSNKKLNAHHLNGYHWCKEGRVDIKNGACLCTLCHRRYHKVYGNKYNTKEQFQEFFLSNSYYYNV